MKLVQFSGRFLNPSICFRELPSPSARKLSAADRDESALEQPCGRASLMPRDESLRQSCINLNRGISRAAEGCPLASQARRYKRVQEI